MPIGFACPNPACGHVFSPASVKGSASLTCPACGNVFQFRAGTASSSSKKSRDPAKQMQPGPGVPPFSPPAASHRLDNPQRSLARPVATATPAPAGPPPGVPVPGNEIAFQSIQSPAIVLRFRGKRSQNLGRRIFFVCFLLLLIGGAGAILFHFRDDILDSFESGASQNAKQFNYRFRVPDNKQWSRDQETERALQYQGLKVKLAMKRSDPSSIFAILARDYERESRPLQDSDLQAEIVTGLKKYFQPLEWEPRSNADLGGQPAHRFAFQGDVGGVTMKGECVMKTHQGFAYWFLCWAPAGVDEEAADEWDGVRQGFSFLNQRGGWTEKTRKLAQAVGVAAPYLLRYPEAFWEKQPLEGYDKNADLVLLGTEPAASEGGGRHDAKRAATVQVLILPTEADLKTAMTSLKKRLLEKQKADNYPSTQHLPVSDKEGPIDRKADVGNLPGWITHLRMKNSDSRERFVLLAVAFLPDHQVAVVCECDWQRRAFWEQEFTFLLDRFERKSGE